MRVYELAKQLGVGSKDLLTALKAGNFPATTHMMILTTEQSSYLEKHFSKSKPIERESTLAPAVSSTKPEPVQARHLEKIEEEAPEKETVEIQKIQEQPLRFEDVEAQEEREQERIKRLLQATGFSGTVLGQAQPRRRRKRRFKPLVTHEEPIKKIITEVILERGVPLFEAADLFGKSSSDLIVALLKKGLACNRNDVLGIDTMKSLGEQFGIPVHVKKDEASLIEEKGKTAISAQSVSRWPVVVVMGHVDHGKTTLLDYVRKMNVAASEKGGITQHIRAWEVDSKHGKIVFLDTPGHEAFSYLRQRGSSITDIVVLVIAVDDGIKPQTVEAIKYAKTANVPIIVAVNKIDKMSSPSALETIKRQLAQNDLMPEDWGGQTVVIPISAKTGQGVDNLLEMIVLQSQIVDLRADTHIPGKAFVLESHIERGLGPVATAIVKEGTLKQGDFFVCGNSTGKVRILMTSVGQRITQAGPSAPVQIVGFDNFASIGDWLSVVSQQEYNKVRAQRGNDQAITAAAIKLAPVVSLHPTAADQKFINIILKTDTRGSREAVTDSITKLVKELKDIKCPINIINTGIGDVTESDIDLAASAQALIVGLHIKVEKNAQLLAKDKSVDIQCFNIIYELIDSLEKLLKSKREVIITWNKVGEAMVKKVFDIKGIGIIAGCYMRDGVLARGNKVACMRDGRQVGEGKVTSLQRDRKTVKEVHAGYECGFTADGFTEWQEGDTVICYAEVKEKPE